MTKIYGLKSRNALMLMVFGLSIVVLPTTLAADNVSAAAKNPAKTTNKSASSAVSKKSKEDQAIELVWRRSDVKAWLKQFPLGKSKLGGQASASADLDKGDIYNVHVYEDFSDHTATFNWYNVNLKTGQITKQF